jgi:hypothetical protein
MHMPIAAAARILGEHDTKLWRVVHHYAEAAVDEMDLGQLRLVCIDEPAENAGTTTSRCSSTPTHARSSTLSTGAAPRRSHSLRII